MSYPLFRTELLLGSENLSKIKASRVIVFGVGGVGGYAIEAIARCGVRKLTLVDFDTVDITNLNRQIIALTDTVGRYKTEVMKERILAISPEIEVEIFSEMLTAENISKFDIKKYDMVIDAIDMFDSKMALIEYSSKMGIKIISAMGAGNRIHPEKLEITDIYKTFNCPLARKVRLECKKRRIKRLEVVFSTENPVVEKANRQVGIPSISFVPAAAGLLMASRVIQKIIMKDMSV
ncbi:MAG: tRNA threonylcarbamoyladenosine dehydratase [Fusobacteria bacterium]|nr:tRNA threonylcarbamoyladenosine dehydratase [Fusobacteriota bacterium]